MSTSTHAVTGAFGYTGKYITQRLLAQGKQVITLTGSPDRPNPFNGQVKAFPFNFDQPEKLAETLQGINTLFNTYWVRFDHGDKTHSRAVANTQVLFQAAKAAGVRRVVHVSICKPSLDSPLPYYHGKAHLEQTLQNSGVSYAILRPTVIFGREDILINNIAWLVRRFPVFAVPGDGRYRLQPIYVEDMADLAIEAAQREDNLIWDIVGPEIYTFNELIHTIAEILGRRPWVVHTPPETALALSKFISRFVGDVMLTREEVRGLMADLLVSEKTPRGQKSLKEWLRENRDAAGLRYASEVARHYKT